MNIFEKQRLEIDLEEKRYFLSSTEKGCEDLAIEVKALHDEFETFPEYSREEFEKAEALYYVKRLIGDAERQLRATGTVKEDFIKHLNILGVDPVRDDKGHMMFLFNEEKVKELGYEISDIKEVKLIEQKEGDK